MTPLYLRPQSRCLAWPDGLPKNYNGSNEPCDMLVGPCCCGAGHFVGEFSNLLLKHDFEIKEFPSDASRELTVEVLGEATVLHIERSDALKEQLRYYPLPPVPYGNWSLSTFLHEISRHIVVAGTEGRRFCRVGFPKGFDFPQEISEWLAASGYQSNWSNTELTIQW